MPQKHVGMEGVQRLRDEVVTLCAEIERMPEENKIINIPVGATGSAAGLPFEDWFYQELRSRITGLGFEIFRPFDFVLYIINEIIDQRRIPLDQLRNNVWWWSIQQFSESLIKRVREGERPKQQQAMGDIIVKYGIDLNDVVLINVKATEVDKRGKPVGRPPNIISSLRLLEFLHRLFTKHRNLIDKVNIWLVCFHYYRPRPGIAKIHKAIFRDLFKLDLSKAPSINFDAAIQIQWHVEEMIEDPSLTIEKFAIILARKLLDEWERFYQKRDRKIRKLTEELLQAIRNSCRQSTLDNRF